MSDLHCNTLLSGPPIRTFLDGSQYWIIDLPSVRIGLGHFKPGWVWSKHAGPQAGLESQSHIGIVQSGRLAVVSANGDKIEVGCGDAFEVGPGHDAWVVGYEMCVALDFTLKP